MNVPYDSGLAFVRDREALRAAMAITAEYLPTETEQRNPADYTPELSRRAGAWRYGQPSDLGRQGTADLVEGRAPRPALAEGLRCRLPGAQRRGPQPGARDFGDAAVTRRVVSDIQRDGTAWCGGTVWQGQTAMRISVSSAATTDEDVERALEVMVRIAREVG